MSKSTTVFLDGQGKIQLGPNDFIARGGEGAVYAHGDLALKVYDDPDRALPAGKLQELSAIADPRVLAPSGLLKRGRPRRVVGYAMPRLDGGHPLCALFAQSFKQRHGLTQEHLRRIALELHARVTSIHRAGVTVVDLNDMNFLVGPKFDAVYAIDVDSYQTASYPATAFSPAVTDPLAVARGTFDAGSDWFAFAVLTFQLFTGLHPFRGKHPQHKRMSERMRRRICALDPDVRWPATADRDALLPAWRDWWQAVLAGDHREAPPPATSAPPQRARPKTGGSRRHELAEAAATIRQLLEGPSGELWFLTDEGYYREGKRIGDAPAGAHLVLSPAGRPLLATTVQEESGLRLRLLDPQGDRALELSLAAGPRCVVDGQLYALHHREVMAIRLHDLGSHVVASATTALRVVPHATQLHDGVVVQSVLGATYLGWFPRPGRARLLRVRELDGMRVVDAAAAGDVLVLHVRPPGGESERWRLRVDPSRDDFDLERDAGSEVAVTVLPKGIAVSLGEDALEIFPPLPHASAFRQVEAGGPVERLATVAGKVLCAAGRRVYRLQSDGQPRQSLPAP